MQDPPLNVKKTFIKIGAWQDTLIFENEERTLTHFESAIIWALMSHRTLNTMDLAEIIYHTVNNFPETWPKCIHIFITRLRRKLLGTGWMIYAIGHLGYRLERQDGDKIPGCRATKLKKYWQKGELVK
jgi:DNA-binding response OmpR family regulator